MVSSSDDAYAAIPLALWSEISKNLPILDVLTRTDYFCKAVSSSTMTLLIHSLPPFCKAKPHIDAFLTYAERFSLETICLLTDAVGLFRQDLCFRPADKAVKLSLNCLGSVSRSVSCNFCWMHRVNAALHFLRFCSNHARVLCVAVSDLVWAHVSFNSFWICASFFSFSSCLPPHSLPCPLSTMSPSSSHTSKKLTLQYNYGRITTLSLQIAWRLSGHSSHLATCNDPKKVTFTSTFGV